MNMHIIYDRKNIIPHANSLLVAVIILYMNIVLRRFLHNLGNSATKIRPKPRLCPTLISSNFKGFLIMHSTIGSTVHSRPLKSLEHCICTTTMTIIWPDRDSNYSGSQSHTTRRGRASCILWYGPVANVCDCLLFLDENRVIPEIRHFWKVTSPDEELFTELYLPSDAFPMTWPSKLFTGLNSKGMKVTWLRTLASTWP